MSSKVPLIGRPNYRAIAGMEGADVVRAREYYLVKLISARRGHDSDTIDACLDWVEALTSEMRLRGGDTQPERTVVV